MLISDDDLMKILEAKRERASYGNNAERDDSRDVNGESFRAEEAPSERAAAKRKKKRCGRGKSFLRGRMSEKKKGE